MTSSDWQCQVRVCACVDRGTQTPLPDDAGSCDCDSSRPLPLPPPPVHAGTEQRVKCRPTQTVDVPAACPPPPRALFKRSVYSGGTARQDAEQPGCDEAARPETGREQIVEVEHAMYSRRK